MQATGFLRANPKASKVHPLEPFNMLLCHLAMLWLKSLAMMTTICPIHSRYMLQEKAGWGGVGWGNAWGKRGPVEDDPICIKSPQVGPLPSNRTHS